MDDLTEQVGTQSNRTGFFYRKTFWWALVIILFAGCVAIKLNGSSVGMWQPILHEPPPTPGLVLFSPKGIRRDEWWIITPAIMSQARRSPAFPIENISLGGGKAPLLMSIPVAHYTTFFRPQLWGFFIFDLERGFSFYWCCKIFGLVLGSICLLRYIGIQSWGIVTFGTIWIFFSSFIQWWFSTPAMLPEMLASWAMLTICALQFFTGTARWHLALAVCGFVFFGINFLLFFYPGFQVPLLYLSIAIIAGIGWSRETPEEWRSLRGLALLGLSLFILVIALVPLWITLRDTIEIVAHTAYPGVYRNNGGALSIFRLLCGVLGFFESEQNVPYDYDNICEASNFYPLWILVLPLVIVAAVRGRRPAQLMLSLLGAIILLGLYCVVPMPPWLAHWSLLGLTTEERLLLGIGIGNVLFCCVFLDRYRHEILPRNGSIAVIAGAICLAAGLLWLHRVSDKTWAICIVVINAVLVILFVWERARLAFLICFAALVAINGARINPIMRGLGPLLESHAFKAIDTIRQTDPGAGWIMYEETDFAGLIIATGASVFNGTKIVPDLVTMHHLDPGRSAEEIYNRYAYISVGLPEQGNDMLFELVTFNGYQLTLPPDLPFLRDNGYRYVVFGRPWSDSEPHGFSFITEIQPTGIYVYKRNSSGQ